MSLKRRLDRLQDARGDAAGREPPPWSPPDTYARMRDDVWEDIARDQAEGVEPLYRVGDDGIIYAASGGRPIRNTRDYVAVLDEHIRELDAEISALEAAEEGEGGLLD